MNIIQLTKKVREYYDTIRPKNLMQGFDKIIATDIDGTDFIILNDKANINSEPYRELILFRCRVTQGSISIEVL